MTPTKREPLRIALLTPYTGLNLGDGAIQNAIIQNLQKRAEGIELYGITLAPTDTQKRHGIPCFPISGLLVRSYSSQKTKFPGVRGRESAVTPKWWAKLKDKVKAAPLLGNSLRHLLQRIRESKLIRGCIQLAREAHHLVRSYHFLRKVDFLIVSGGGQLDEEWGGPWGHPYALCRWAFLAKLTRTGFALTSVGTGVLKSSLARWFVKMTLTLACFRSYRDQGSKAQISCFFPTSKDPCVPDLAFSLPFPACSPGWRNRGFGVVGISPIGYGDPREWATHDQAVYHTYIINLADFTHALIRQGYHILLFLSGADDRALIDLKGSLKERYGSNILHHVSEPPIGNVEDLLKHISRADYVVASRLHGVILSHVLRKPALAISFDRKVNAHMEHVGQIAYCVEIHRPDWRHWTERFYSLAKNRETISVSLDSRINGFQPLLDQQYEYLLKRVKRKKQTILLSC